MVQSVIFLFLILVSSDFLFLYAFFALMALSILAAIVFSIIGVVKNKKLFKIIPIVEIIISIALGTFEVICSGYIFIIKGLAESERQNSIRYKELLGTPEKFLSNDNSNYYIFYYPEDPESEYYRYGVKIYDNDGLLKNRLLSIDFYESGKSKYRDGEKYITYYMRYDDFAYLRLEEDGEASICISNDIFGGPYYYYYRYDASYFDELYQIQALIINQDL